MDKIKINDRRPWSPDFVPEPKEACRVCGAEEVHSTEYNKPTMKCIEQLRSEINQYKSKTVNVVDFHKMEDKIKLLEDAAEMLWVVLANVSGGDWRKQSKEWRDAAARWRDNYFTAIGKGK